MLPRTRFDDTIERPEYSLKTLRTSAMGISSKFTVMRRSCDCCCGTATVLPLMFIVGVGAFPAGTTFSRAMTGAAAAEAIRAL